MDWGGRPALAFLAAKEEDRFSIYLAELLRYGPFLESFCERLLNFNLLPYTNSLNCVSTQQIVDGGRPDVVTETGKLLCFIEAQVSSYLHTDQLVPYARHLINRSTVQADTKIKLAILTPETSAARETATGSAQLKSAGLELELSCICWEQIAELLRNILTTDKHPSSFVNHAETFCDWIELLFGKELPALADAQIQALSDRRVGQAVAKAYRLVDRLSAQLTANGGHEVVFSQRTCKEDYYGFIIKIGDKELAWIGVWLGPWAQYGITPIWLEFKDVAISAGATVFQHKQSRHDYLLTPLRLMPAESDENAVQRIAKIINELIPPRKLQC